MANADKDVLEAISASAEEITGDPKSDYDRLIDDIGDAQVVCIGEASHGTREFYASRAEITKRLLREEGFDGVAIEADWPDAYRAHRWALGRSDDASANEALGDFERFPTWMWRNTEVIDFLEWLRDFNQEREADEQAGFFGIDLYSLNRSRQAVVDYLDDVDPEAADRARDRYACFEQFGEDPQAYGYAASFNLEAACEDETVAQLVELRNRSADFMREGGLLARDEQFFAEQNALVARNAERYYRSMFNRNENSWNLRDRHMFQTLQALVDFHQGRGRGGKFVVWEHNSHLGDCRATAMAKRGQINVGQLVRESYGDDSYLVGYTTHTGTVSAADDWGGDVRRKRVRPSLEGSVERLFHTADTPTDFRLDLRDERVRGGLSKERLERAIGVIYKPETERWSHYFGAEISRQFDTVIHYDSTQALEPLERSQHWEDGEEFPETYPSGM